MKLDIRTTPEALEVSFAWRDRLDWRVVSTLLFILAALVGIALAVRYILVVAETYGLFIPLALFGILPMVSICLSLVQTFRNRTQLRATADEITVAWGPHGAGKRTVQTSGLRQLFSVAGRSGRSAIFAVTDGDRPVTVVQQLTPEAAIALEEALEAFLEIQDRPVAGELPKGEALAELSRGSYMKPVAIGLVALTVIGFGVNALRGPSIRGVVAELDVKEGPRSLSLDLEETTPVEVWVKMEIAWDAVLGNAKDFHLDRLPHAFELAITVESEGRDISRTICDPFRVRFFETQSTIGGITEMSVFWFGALEGCTVQLLPGRSKVGAELSRTEAGREVRVDRSEILLRQ